MGVRKTGGGRRVWRRRGERMWNGMWCEHGRGGMLGKQRERARCCRSRERARHCGSREREQDAGKTESSWNTEKAGREWDAGGVEWDMDQAGCWGSREVA